MNVRFGKKPPIIDYRTLYFNKYVKEDIPEPPEEYENLDKVFVNLLDQNVGFLFPMDKNDELGDCTIAGAAHAITVYHGLIKQRDIPPEKEVVKVYNHLTGGVDSGLAMLDVLNYWRRTGMFNNKIMAFMRVNAHNHKHVKQAIKLFGGLFIGFQVHQECIDEFNERKPWSPGNFIYSGHAVYVTGYDESTLNMLTWGSTQKGFWTWWDIAVDEAYAILPPEALEEGFAPGFDLIKLQDDLQEVAII